jgi:dihydroorotase
MNRVCIEGGRLIDPASGRDSPGELYIADGRIVGLDVAPEGFDPDSVIDAAHCLVFPGLIDLQARLREPGAEHKGNIRSESRAAAAGGVTTLCLPPDTDPCIDSAAVVELVHRCSAYAGGARVETIGALTAGLRGKHLSEMAGLRAAGCIAVSNAGRRIASSQVMRRALEYAADQGLLVVIQPNDLDLADGGCAHEGPVALRLGLPGIPEAAETAALARDLELLAQTGARAHFTCLSTRRAVDMIGAARSAGLKVTADCAAHQLFLCDRDVDVFNALCHVLPPLRDQRDREGLRRAIADGELLAICSDHQPHDTDAKLAPFPATEPGISAVETLLPLTLRLVEEGSMSLADALARVTVGPATVLGLDTGRLEVGAAADICVFDPRPHWRLVPQELQSHGKNSPFGGWDFRGKVTHTLLGGQKIYSSSAPG